MKEKWENIVEFIKMILFVLMTGHLMAICFYSIAVVDIRLRNSTITWIQRENIMESSI